MSFRQVDRQEHEQFRAIGCPDAFLDAVRPVRSLGLNQGWVRIGRQVEVIVDEAAAREGRHTSGRVHNRFVPCKWPALDEELHPRADGVAVGPQLWEGTSCNCSKVVRWKVGVLDPRLYRLSKSHR